MNAVEAIDRVLASSVLRRELVVIPDRGATEGEILDEQRALAREMSRELVTFLRRWNGALFDVLCLFRCGETHAQIPSFRDDQLLLPNSHTEGLVIGGDPAGFVYVETLEGKIASLDTDGGGWGIIASSFDDFVCRFVF